MTVRDNVIWKDGGFIEKTRMIFFVIAILLFVLCTFLSENLSSKILFIILAVVSLYFTFVVQGVRKLSLIRENGIGLGNIEIHNWEKKNLRKRIFFEWKQIRNLKIEKHSPPTPRARILRDFLILNSKKGKKHECILYDPQGFVKALVKLNRASLLDKESRRKYGK